MAESTERRSASPPVDDGKQQQARDRSKSPAQQTQPLAGAELTRELPPSPPEATGGGDGGDGGDGAEPCSKKQTEERSSSPPAGDRSRPSSPTAKQSSPTPKEMASDGRRSSTDGQESLTPPAGDEASEEKKLSDAANEPTLAGTPEEEGEKAEKEQLEAAEKPAPSIGDEQEQEVAPEVVASPARLPSPAPEPEVTKPTSPNHTEKVVAETEDAATEAAVAATVVTVTAVATVTAAATETSEGEQKAAAVVIDEPRRSPVPAAAAAEAAAVVPEQSRRSRSNRSHSSSSSGSSGSSSSSDSTSASGHHSSDGADGGSLPKKVKLEPVEHQQQQELGREADVAMQDGQVKKLREGSNCTTPSGGGTSILKARIEQGTAERPAATAAKPPSQMPSREQSLRSSLNSDGSVSPRRAAGAEMVEPEVRVTATPTMETAGQSGTPSVAPLLHSLSSVASSRAGSPSLASSSAQSTPTKDKADPADQGGGGGEGEGGEDGGPGDGTSQAVQPALKVVKVAVGVVGLEKPDSARLTADLQSCKRQLAEVRSKYDVTRKELHATKRKLKRMSVRLNGMAANNNSATSAASGANSPHVAGAGAAATAAPSDEDRNRKWREPMILSAMKIKAAMGIQAYKSLIKDGELLLPSLRTITRYLESLRKAGGGNGLAVAAAAAASAAVGGGGGAPGGAGAAKSTNAAIDVDEEDEEDDEEDDVVLATAEVADQQQQQQQQQQGPARRKLAKAGADGVRRTVDHNRNEQRHGNGGAVMRNSSGRFVPLHPHAPEVHLQDIKTEQDPVSFTASPDINYYQHNANDDDDDDEDGYQDPTSLLEQSRYDGDGGVRLNGDDTGYHHQQYAGHQANQQQTLTQAQIEFLKSMVGFRKKWTPYELRTCNEIRLIIGSREYDSLRKNDGMPLPSVKTLRKYRNTEQAPVDLSEEVDLTGRKRKHHEMLAEEGGGVAGDPAPGRQHKAAEAYGEGRLFPYRNATAKVMKAEQDSEDGHFDVGVLTKAQISFLKTLSLNTKGFSDYELQRSLELKNELGSKNYETLRKQEFLNIPTLVMLTRYEQDNGLEDLSRMAGATITVDGDEHDGRGGDGVPVELVDNDGPHTVDEEDRLQHSRQQQLLLEEEQAREQQQQQQQLELYNRLTQADLTRHPLFDSIAGDTSPVDGADPTATAAAIAAAMAAAAVSMQQSLDLNGGTGDDSSLGIFENHSIFDKDSPTFDMSKLSPAHVEFLNTLPENPKRWTQEMINSALDIKNEIGTRDYEILRRQGIPLPAARTLRRHKDIRNKADRAMSEPGEILPGSGATAGVVGSG